jgi:hypothetical protein
MGRFFASRRVLLLFIPVLLILFALAALSILHPWQGLWKKDSEDAGYTQIDYRYMGEVTGIDTSEKMLRQYELHPEAYKFAIEDDLVVMLAYPDSDIRWIGMIFIHHIPSVSETVLDYDGNIIYEQVRSAQVQTQVESYLNDSALVARLKNQMDEIWGLDEPGDGVLGLVDSLNASGIEAEFIGGRPQTLHDAAMFLILVNHQDISVFEFDNQAARNTVSENISPDGSEFTRREDQQTIVLHIEYQDQPNFWVKDNLLVQYLGRDKTTIDSISMVLGDPITTHDVGNVDICDLYPVPGIIFPRQEPVEGAREVMEAELIGDLVLEHSCIQISSLYNEGSYLPIWPSDFQLERDGDTLVILDGNGVNVAQVGEEVYMGGGIASGSSLPACIQQQIPENCEGDYWFVGEGVRPNFVHDSDLVNLEVVSSDDRSAILISPKTTLDGWVEEDAIISGILRLYSPQRCPRIKSESGMIDYLPIWPPTYALQINDGLVEIYDDAGEIIAREGERVTLPGGAVPHNWDSEQYRQLFYDIPGDCHGPYWIIYEVP